MINRVVLVGRLTRDPELTYTPSGTASAKTGIALDDPFRKGEDGNPAPNFFNIVAWGKTAEYAANYLQKGRLVGIDGRLQYRAWVDAQGQKRNAVEVVADRIQALERSREETGSPGSGLGTKDAGDEYDPFAEE